MRLARRDLSMPDRELTAARTQDWCNQHPDLELESHQRVTQGGDKHRLTVVTFQMVTGWFDPACEPKGRVPPIVLVVPSSLRCRLEDTDASGKWNKNVSYQVGDELVEFKVGQSAKGLLQNWRATRDMASPEGQAMFQNIRVWGQPSGWTDEVITSWLSNYVKDQLAPDGCLQIVDCLGSQWSDVTLAHCWANQQAQIPIAPSATSLLQVADTHIHSPVKA